MYRDVFRNGASINLTGKNKVDIEEKKKANKEGHPYEGGDELQWWEKRAVAKRQPTDTNRAEITAENKGTMQKVRSATRKHNAPFTMENW